MIGPAWLERCQGEVLGARCRRQLDRGQIGQAVLVRVIGRWYHWLGYVIELGLNDRRRGGWFGLFGNGRMMIGRCISSGDIGIVTRGRFGGR